MDRLPWPLPSVSAEGGPRSGVGTAPPEEAEAGTLVPRLLVPADCAAPFPYPGAQPQASAGGHAGLPLNRGEHRPLKPNRQSAGPALEVSVDGSIT